MRLFCSQLQAVCQYLVDRIESLPKFIIFAHHQNVLDAISQLFLEQRVSFTLLLLAAGKSIAHRLKSLAFKGLINASSFLFRFGSLELMAPRPRTIGKSWLKGSTKTRTAKPQFSALWPPTRVSTWLPPVASFSRRSCGIPALWFKQVEIDGKDKTSAMFCLMFRYSKV